MDPALYPNATFPDEETLKVGLGFLRKASAQRNASGTPFWLGVGFVKPHLPHVFPKKFGELVPATADIDLPPNPNVRPSTLGTFRSGSDQRGLLAVHHRLPDDRVALQRAGARLGQARQPGEHAEPAARLLLGGSVL